MTTWKQQMLVLLGLGVIVAIVAAVQMSSSSAYGQNESSSALSQIYENKTANIRINYPANWFSETRNIEYPLTVRFFPTEFMAERNPPVVLGISLLNASDSSKSLNLTEMAGIYERLAQSSPDTRFVNSTVNATMFNGTVPAFQINYFDFSRPFMNTEELITGTFVNNTKTGYVLQYYAEPEFFDKYLPQVQKMIDSLQLLRNESRPPDVKDNNNSEASFFQTFKDENANFKIQYPGDWETNTKNLADPEIVHIFPTEFMAERDPPVELIVGVIENVRNTNITEYAEILMQNLESEPDIKVINSTTGANITLLNGTQPAQLVHAYDFSIPSHDRQIMSMNTVLDDGLKSDIYYVEFSAEPENFDRYLPEAQKMINSFQVLNNK